jgi:hypothetical protein
MVSVNQRYTIRLVARNEGIEYRDESAVYRFNVRLADGIWRVYLPGSKGENYQMHILTDQERYTVLPRIAEYLERKKYFGFVGSTYPVAFEQEGPVSAWVDESRRKASLFWEHRKKE